MCLTTTPINLGCISPLSATSGVAGAGEGSGATASDTASDTASTGAGTEVTAPPVIFWM